MAVHTPASVLQALAELRQELEGEVKELEERRSGLVGWELEAPELDKESTSKRRMLELVKGTEEQLARQGTGQRVIEGDGPGPSTQVRGSAKLQDITRPVGPT
jgi:uncharacterized protein involved in exopolysaccharide biosynthesis